FAIRAAARLDLDAFADEELARRRLLGYPPSGVLARLLIADPDRGRANTRGAAAAEAVRTAGVDVFGPLPAYVARRAGRWRVQVVLRAADVEQGAEALARVPAGVGIDADPESLLSPRRLAGRHRYNAAMGLRRILTADEPMLREK